MKNYIKYLPWIILVIGYTLFVRQCGKATKVEYITIEKEILVPSVEKVFDTVYKPVPQTIKVKEIDSVYYEEYTKLKDSIQKDSMFRESIKINEYKQTFKDTLQTIEVYSKTRGDLLEQSIKYKTNPYYIKIKDSVKVNKKTTVSLGAELGVPTTSLLNRPIIKGNLIITNKKGNSLSASYDTQGVIWVGKSWKIFN